MSNESKPGEGKTERVSWHAFNAAHFFAEWFQNFIQSVRPDAEPSPDELRQIRDQFEPEMEQFFKGAMDSAYDRGRSHQVTEDESELADLTARLKQAEAERDAAIRQRERVDKFRERLRARHRMLLNDLGVTKDLCDALQQRLSALEPDPDAPGPASANARAAQARADSGMWSNLCGQLRAELAVLEKERDDLLAQREQYEGWHKWKEGLWRITHSPDHDGEWVGEAGVLTELRADLMLLGEERDTLRTALEQYADPGNWHVGSKYDGESRNFTGPDEARKALDETERGEKL